MDAKVLGAQLHKPVDGTGHLILGHAVFGIPGHIHNGVAQAEGAAGVIAQADRLRHGAQLFQEIHIGGIIQVDVGPHLPCLAHVLFRGHIGGEHHLVAGNAHGLRQQQLRIGGAVAAAALLVQHLENIGIGGCLYREILLKALIPGKRGLQRPGISSDAGLVIQMKGGGDLLDDFLCLVQGDKRGLLHDSLPLFRWGISMGRKPSHREGAGCRKTVIANQPAGWCALLLRNDTTFFDILKPSRREGTGLSINLSLRTSDRCHWCGNLRHGQTKMREYG